MKAHNWHPCKGFRLIAEHVIKAKLAELRDAGVDIDALPGSMTVNELLRMKVG